MRNLINSIKSDSDLEKEPERTIPRFLSNKIQ